MEYLSNCLISTSSHTNANIKGNSLYLSYIQIQVLIFFIESSVQSQGTHKIIRTHILHRYLHRYFSVYELGIINYQLFYLHHIKLSHPDKRTPAHQSLILQHIIPLIHILINQTIKHPSPGRQIVGPGLCARQRNSPLHQSKSKIQFHIHTARIGNCERHLHRPLWIYFLRFERQNNLTTKFNHLSHCFLHITREINLESCVLIYHKTPLEKS
ncbi:hypothetical protein ES705_27301 [subsurface metagenome]